MIGDVIDLTGGDGYVLKRIIQVGDGKGSPSIGCQVIVHYTGMLMDGTKFDSSKDRNEPFEFSLGKDSVIKGWEVGVPSMCRGEICELTIQSDFAYGPRGKPPKIPPDATLKFEIEMLDWCLEDISPKGNKGILRQVILKGTGYDSPNDGAQVTIEIEGRLPDGALFDQRTVCFVMGEGHEQHICEGIERAIERATTGDKIKLVIQPRYAFKAEGNSVVGVPPNTVVEYIVKVVSFEKAKEPWAMQSEEKLEQAKIVKEKGTSYFKVNNYQLAIKKYKKVVTYLDDLAKDSSEQKEHKEQAVQLLLSVYLNLALVYLKVSMHYDARDHADKALDLDPHNVKGHFRKGQALLGLGEAEQAMAVFQKVIEMEPENKAAANQMIMCRNTLAKQKKKEVQLYANMFDKFAIRDTQAERDRAQAEAAAGGGAVGEWGAPEGEWTDRQRDRKPTDFERENPNILMLDKDGQFENM